VPVIGVRKQDGIAVGGNTIGERPQAGSIGRSSARCPRVARVLFR
jgi:hypothetical protein